MLTGDGEIDGVVLDEQGRLLDQLENSEAVSADQDLRSQC